MIHQHLQKKNKLVLNNLKSGVGKLHIKLKIVPTNLINLINIKSEVGQLDIDKL